jgi:Trk-type K+ transport system membrane component
VISFRKIQDSSEGVKTITSAKVNEMLKNDAKYIQQYKSLYYASIATFFTIVIYIFSWIIFGAVFLTIALSQQPMEDNLHERNFSYFQNGLYLTISAFSNAGLSLSGDSFLHMNTNAGELTFH